MEKQAHSSASKREATYRMLYYVAALMLIAPCLASAQSSDTETILVYPDLERSGDWIVRTANIPFYALEIRFYPNASGSGTFYEDKPVKIFTQPKTAVLKSCPQGYKKEGRYCYSCPSGYNRTIWDINSNKACEKNILTPSSADVIAAESCGNTRNTYMDINGTCYECPASFNVIALENSHGNRKCQKPYDSIVSFDEVYYTEPMLQSTFDENQLECLQSGDECYVAHVSTMGNFRYGRHCGPGFGGGEPIDMLDAACQAHDAHEWEENVVEGEDNTDFEGFNCANEFGFKRTVSRIIEDYENSNSVSPIMIDAAKATLSELWFVGTAPCPEANFPEDDPFDFFNSTYFEDPTN